MKNNKKEYTQKHKFVSCFKTWPKFPDFFPGVLPNWVNLNMKLTLIRIIFFDCFNLEKILSMLLKVLTVSWDPNCQEKKKKWK